MNLTISKSIPHDISYYAGKRTKITYIITDKDGEALEIEITMLAGWDQDMFIKAITTSFHGSGLSPSAIVSIHVTEIEQDFLN